MISRTLVPVLAKGPSSATGGQVAECRCHTRGIINYRRAIEGRERQAREIKMKAPFKIQCENVERFPRLRLRAALTISALHSAKFSPKKRAEAQNASARTGPTVLFQVAAWQA